MDNAPSWNGRKIAKDEDKHDLESRAAVYEFKHRMARPDAEHRAHHEYKQDKHREAAAYHLQGLKAAQAAGSHEEGHKHGMMYQLHMKELGLDPMGPVPHEIQGLADKQEKFYRFKAHRSDTFLLQNEGLGKSEAKRCWNSGQWTGSREAARVHHCSCGAHLEVTPKRNPKVAGDTLTGWHVRVPAHDEGGKTQKSELAKADAKVIPFRGNPSPAVDQGKSASVARLPVRTDWVSAGKMSAAFPPVQPYTPQPTPVVSSNPQPAPISIEQCQAVGNHNADVDSEGFCTFCNQRDVASADKQRVSAIGLKEKQEARRQLARTKVQGVFEDAAHIMGSDPGFQELARQRDVETKKAKLKAGGQLYKEGQTVTHIDPQRIPWQGVVHAAHGFQEHGVDGPGNYYEVRWWNPKLKQHHEETYHQDDLKPG